MALQGAFYASQTASAAYSIYSQYQQLQNCLQNVDSTDISEPNKKKIEFLVDQVHLLTVLRDGCTSAIGLQPSPELPPEQQRLLRDKDRPRCTSAVSACVRLQYHMHTKACAQCAVRLSLPIVEQDSWMYDLWPAARICTMNISPKSTSELVAELLKAWILLRAHCTGSTFWPEHHHPSLEELHTKFILEAVPQCQSATRLQKSQTLCNCSCTEHWDHLHLDWDFQDDEAAVNLFAPWPFAPLSSLSAWKWLWVTADLEGPLDVYRTWYHHPNLRSWRLNFVVSRRPSSSCMPLAALSHSYLNKAQQWHISRLSKHGSDTGWILKTKP